jgi:sn-glycerol 3-phosphate transport system ATP-binding protein
LAEIAIRKVHKSYGRNAVVHGVDVTVNNGEFAVILGPSGCGKSTLLRMIAGLEDITGGEIAIGGTVVNKMEPRERGCAMVFQNYALYPHMNVAENIGYALRVAGVSKAERTERIARVAKTLALDDFLDRKPGQLSGGQRQRVAMGRAMIREPKVFLFDEPLSNLDAKLRVQMRLELRRLHNRLSATSVFVTHDQVEAMTLADKVIVMNKGRVEQVGTPIEIYNRPQTLFVAGFIGSPPMNILNATIRDQNAVTIDGLSIECPIPAGLKAGTAVAVGIRPEHVQIGAPNNAGSILKVEVIEKLGPVQLVHGTLGGQEFVVQAAAEAQLDGVALLGLAIAPGALHLFSPESGERLDADAVARAKAA